MVSLGIRITSSLIRYAIIKKENGNINFINADSENLIKFPASCEKIEDKIKWTYEEIGRIFMINPNITSIAIKEDEILSRKTTASREKAYIIGTIMLFARQKGIPVKQLISKQIGTKSENVLANAEKYGLDPLKYKSKWDAELTVEEEELLDKEMPEENV